MDEFGRPVVSLLQLLSRRPLLDSDLRKLDFGTGSLHISAILLELLLFELLVLLKENLKEFIWRSPQFGLLTLRLDHFLFVTDAADRALLIQEGLLFLRKQLNHVRVVDR